VTLLTIRVAGNLSVALAVRLRQGMAAIIPVLAMHYRGLIHGYGLFGLLFAFTDVDGHARLLAIPSLSSAADAISMLNSLGRIVQDVNAAPNLEEAVWLIVRRTREVMGTDVCSVYLSEEASRRYVLMATEGLRASAVGRVSLGYEQGLVGLVAARAETVNLANAPAHPRFRFIPEAGEDSYRAFLGVPVIHRRKVLGVLVAQQRSARRFREEHVAFLVTLAAQLAGAIALAKAGGLVHRLGQSSGWDEQHFDGLPAVPGVATGLAVVVYPPMDLNAVPDRSPKDLNTEEAALRVAVERASTEVKQLGARLEGVMSAEDRALFDAYTLMMTSPGIIEDTVVRIQAGNWAPGALRETINEHARRFEAMQEPYLRERANDIRDLGVRILLHLSEVGRSTRDYASNTILVGEQLSAMDLVEVPPDRLSGVVSARGSALSHVAVLAHALGCPAVMGVADLPVTRLDGQELVLDGYRGRIYIKPNASVRREFAKFAREERELQEELKKLHNLPAKTPDGVIVPLYTNIGLLAGGALSLDGGAEGVGLYRTELPFMVREGFPSEEEQQGIYRQVLEAFAPRPVVLRTLDAGGDKALPYFSVAEDNPFLGWRGIRMTLDHPEILVTQFRAALRAAVGLDNLSLLLPMVTGVTEVEDATELLDRAHQELLEEEVPVTRPRVGVMIEVPSAVFQAPELARRVDFLSIGTNDLMQYLLAADRNNPRVAKILQPLHPAVLRALIDVIKAGSDAGKPVSVCGETAGDPAVAVLLLGMGVDSLSVSVSDLPRLKRVLRTVSRRTARELLATALTYDKPEPIRDLLNEALESHGLGALIRPGK
jgi:phosphotransferase system enzyme I (PtsP)